MVKGSQTTALLVLAGCRHVLASLLFVAAAVGIVAAAQADMIGVASVIDGDTIEIHGQRIRLHGIDAPESSQTCLDAGGRTWRCGQRAALTLQDMIERCTISAAPALVEAQAVAGSRAETEDDSMILALHQSECSWIWHGIFALHNGMGTVAKRLDHIQHLSAASAGSGGAPGKLDLERAMSRDD